jgi:hypothetical protein
MPENKLPSIEENPQGFHQRYVVTKTNGEPVDPRAIYLVLRLDPFGDDLEHVRACRAAAVEYAKKAPPHLTQMAEELLERLEGSEAEFQRAIAVARATRIQVTDKMPSPWEKTKNG